MASVNSKRFARTYALVEGEVMSDIVAPELEPRQLRERSRIADDPFALFQNWFQEAIDSGLKEPCAMTVATVDRDGFPEARMLLLKGLDKRGFVFYTNMQSPKARALLHNPRVALCFYWAKIDKQVRIRGRAEIVSVEEADAYFATRPRLSQISAWASKQSRPMRGYFQLEADVTKAMIHFRLGEVPRPPFWSGFRVVPHRIEFWSARLGRLHERRVFVRSGDDWIESWLFP
jgi:pyridoxamine 5'-phosphate oxidase